MQQLGTSLVELFQRSRLRDRQQPQRHLVRAGLMLASSGEQSTLCPAFRIRRKLDGSLVKRRLRRQATTGPCSSRRALQLGGDVLVEPGCRVREVPRAAIRVDISIGGLGKRAVDALALLRRCRSLDFTWLAQEVTTRLPGRMNDAESGYASAADLQAALRRAEAAHREHEGQDEDWAAWYAAYMVAEQAGTDLPS